MKKTISCLLLTLCLVNNSLVTQAITINNNNLSLVDSGKVEDVFDLRAKVAIKAVEDVLKATKPTGNIDIDYLNQMIKKHSEEIQLSLAIQSYTNNPTIISLANDILAAENGELREMRIYRKELFDKYKAGSEEDKEYIDESKKIQENMFKSFKDYKPTANDDKDYLNYILIGNNASIDMSKLALKSLKNDITKKIAQNIIREKTEQNRTIEDLLKK